MKVYLVAQIVREDCNWSSLEIYAYPTKAEAASKNPNDPIIITELKYLPVDHRITIDFPYKLTEARYKRWYRKHGAWMKKVHARLDRLPLVTPSVMYPKRKKKVK